MGTPGILETPHIWVRDYFDLAPHGFQDVRQAASVVQMPMAEDNVSMPDKSIPRAIALYAADRLNPVSRRILSRSAYTRMLRPHSTRAFVPAVFSLSVVI